MMVESENSDEMNDKIKLFNSDESLKLLGELLSNKSSRNIIGLLAEKERYKNEISTKLNLRLNLVSHHLEKMESIGLVETSYKKIIRKGEDHKFFKVNPKIFIIPNHSEEEIKEKGILTRIFKDGIKFASIGLAGVVSFLISNSLQSTDKWANPSLSKPDDFLISIIIGLIVTIIGLIIYIKFKK